MSKIRKEKNGRFQCLCCKIFTLTEVADYQICDCWWEDDGQEDSDADDVRGGANGDYSLTEAKDNYKKYGIMYRPSDPRYKEEKG